MYTLCVSGLKEFRVGTGVILKEGSFKKPANMFRTFSLACKAPAGLVLAEGTQLTVIQNGIPKMSRDWALEIERAANGMRDWFD